MKKRKTPDKKHPLFGATFDLKKYHPADPNFPQRRVTIAVDERGRPVGESHHRAKLTDEDVELIRDIYAEGMESYASLAVMFGVKKSTIQDIVNFRRRAVTPADYVTRPLNRSLPLSRIKQLGIDVEVLDTLKEWDDND